MLAMGKHKPMNVIVAVDECSGIGKGGQVPWRLPREMAYFAEKTTKTSDTSKRNAVLMGRKVWESIPKKWRPLKGRLNVVLSRTIADIIDENVIVARSFQDAVGLLQQMDDIETIWNIGGSEVYRAGLSSPYLHQLYITRVSGAFDADVFFPPVNFDEFCKEAFVGDSPECEENGIKYRYEIYSRRV